MKTPNIYISNNIKALRFRSRMTQEKLAKKLGCNRQNIRSWEEGRAEPPLRIIYKIAKMNRISFERIVFVNIYKAWKQ